MSIEITKLSDLTSSDVQSQLATIVQLLQEENPTLDLKRGVVHDVLAYGHAILSTKHKTELQRYLNARSLQQITADPTLADSDIVDDVLSNWGVTRGIGSNATGEVTIVLTKNTSVTIGAGTVFTANGISFQSDAAYTAKPNAANVLTALDRPMTQLADGNWAFTVTVTAVDSGTEALLKKDTLIIPSVLPANYLTSYVTNDFTGGVNTETNSELLTRLQQGIAAKAPSNRVSMAAMLRAQSAFNRVVNQSIVGFGDAEMLRDRHTIFPVSYGGRVDWYVRTQERALATTLTKSGMLLSKDSTGGTWQIMLDVTDLPGLYEITSVLPSELAQPTEGTLTILSEVRSMVLPDTGYVPDIEATVEGIYTAYQTVSVVVRDTLTDHTDIAVGDYQDFAVTGIYLPQLADIQAFVNSYEVRSAMADVLVKAPVPCFVDISCTISKKNTQADPDVAAITQAIAQFVNNVDFIGQLSTSSLHDIIHGYLSSGMSVASSDLFGRIRRPDGTMLYLRDDELLQVPDEPASMVSPKTVQFFTDPQRIAITVKADVPVPA